MDTATRPAPTTLAFHASRIVIDVGVLIVLAAMSLPFVTAAGGNRSAIELDALPVLLLLAPVFLVTLIPDHTRPLHRLLGWAALVLGLAAFPYALVKYLDSGLVADSLDGDVGLGAYVIVGGTFLTLVGIIIGLARDWMGLPSGGTPTRRRAVTTRRRRRQKPSSLRTGPDRAEIAGPPSDPVENAISDQPVAETRPLPSTAQKAQTRPANVPPAEAERPEPIDDSRRRPMRAEPDVNPFPDPLFDSLEIPATRSADEDPEETHGTLFHQGTASERFVDESDAGDD